MLRVFVCCQIFPLTVTLCLVVRPASPLTLGDMKVRDFHQFFRIWSVPLLFGQSKTVHNHTTLLQAALIQDSSSKNPIASEGIEAMDWRRQFFFLSSVFSHRLHPPKVKYSFAWRADMISHTIFLANQLMNISSTGSTTVAVVCKPIRYINNILLYIDMVRLHKSSL